MEAHGRTFSLEVARSRSLINFRRPRRHFERAFSLDLAVSALELARPCPPGRLRALIFESETPVFSSFCSCAERATRKTSDINKTLVGVGRNALRSDRATIENRSKIDRSWFQRAFGVTIGLGERSGTLRRRPGCLTGRPRPQHERQMGGLGRKNASKIFS